MNETSLYRITDLLNNVAEEIYPSTTKNYNGKNVNFPIADADIDKIDKAIERACDYMKARCREIKTESCKNYVKNMSRWLENNKDTLSEEIVERYNRTITEANKWVEENKSEMID